MSEVILSWYLLGVVLLSLSLVEMMRAPGPARAARTLALMAAFVTLSGSLVLKEASSHVLVGLLPLVAPAVVGYLTYRALTSRVGRAL